MGSYLATQPGIDIVIDGHTDNTGPPSRNDERSISMKRAKAVKQQLIRNNVAMEAIFTRAWQSMCQHVPIVQGQVKLAIDVLRFFYRR